MDKKEKAKELRTHSLKMLLGLMEEIADGKADVEHVEIHAVLLDTTKQGDKWSSFIDSGKKVLVIRYHNKASKP